MGHGRILLITGRKPIRRLADPLGGQDGNEISKTGMVMADLNALVIFARVVEANSPYLEKHGHPETPQDLPKHGLRAASHGNPQNRWHSVHTAGQNEETLGFQPFLAMNDYAGLAPALVAGVGIGELTPVVQPDLVRDGRLVE